MSVSPSVQPLARVNRATRRVLGADDVSDLPAAAQAVLATVGRWWQQRADAAGLTGRWTDVSEAVSAKGPHLVEVPWRRDLLDAEPHALGEAYVAALTPSVRAHTGRHYTPQSLAGALWGDVVDVQGPRVDGLTFDPACGAGALLLPVLRAWVRRAQDERVEPADIIAQSPRLVGGCDLDAAAVWLGNVLLAAELLPPLSAVPEAERRPFPALLSVADGLAAGLPRARTVVLNPPYGRVRLSDEDRSTWGHVLSGHANRYYLHLAAAVRQVEPGGVVAALVPAGWLGGSYARRLREHLAEQAPLRRLTYVRDRTGVFSTGVIQETVLAAFEVGGATAKTECDSIYVEPSGRAVREPIGVALTLDGDRPAFAPRRATDVPLITAGRSMDARLSSYGWKARTGPLVWNRRKEALSAQSRTGSLKVVWAADIDGGRLHQDARRDSMRYVQVPPGERGTMSLSSPGVLVQRTTSPEQARRLVAASVSLADLAAWGGSVIVENHVNVLTCDDPASPLTPRLLTAFLDSPVLDRLYRCLSGSVAVSAYELAALPLPDAATLRELAALGDEMLAQAIEDVYVSSSE